MKKSILIILGSTRQKSTNHTIAAYIKSHFQDKVRIEIYDQIDQLPHFNPDLDKETPPESVSAFREKLQYADGVLFCTPEYVFTLPGSLKNAIDWQVSTTLFSDKPVAIIVASASGIKAMETLEMVLTTIEAKVIEGATLVVQSAKGKITPQGEITDAGTVEQIQQLMEHFISNIST